MTREDARFVHCWRRARDRLPVNRRASENSQLKTFRDSMGGGYQT
ncbi:hypothetical protein VT84_08575 [Gemmata sp. SH-PL17]|nr:hypothetical protein VT84_08575 [Gemmata sp. SH-PL17]